MKLALKFLRLCLLVFPLMGIAQEWSSLNARMFSAQGTLGRIQVMGIYRNELYVSGGFVTINGKQIERIAKWDGSNWSEVGCATGLSGIAKAMAVYNDELYVAGINAACNLPPNPGVHPVIAKWNGSSWSLAGNELTNNGTVDALVVYKGELYAGGNFSQIGGKTVNRIARWNGTEWNLVGSGLTGGFPMVTALAVYNDELYVTGSFERAGGKLATNIARWNGTTWNPVGNGLDGAATVMLTDTTNNVLYLSGGFRRPLGSSDTLGDLWGKAKWNGSRFYRLDSPISNGGFYNNMTMYRNMLFTGGRGKNVGSITDTIISYWDGSMWYPVTGLDENVLSMVVYKDHLIVGGHFSNVHGDSTLHGIASYYLPPVGIDNQNPAARTINLYPNPVKDQLFIQSEEQLISYKIRNLLGTEIAQDSLRNNTISLEGMPGGIYIIQLNTRQGTVYFGRFIRE